MGESSSSPEVLEVVIGKVLLPQSQCWKFSWKFLWECLENLLGSYSLPSSLQGDDIIGEKVMNAPPTQGSWILTPGFIYSQIRYPRRRWRSCRAAGLEAELLLWKGDAVDHSPSHAFPGDCIGIGNEPKGIRWKVLERQWTQLSLLGAPWVTPGHDHML